MDSIPFVCITGQVATSAIGTDAFQESDTTGITLGVTKHNWLVTDAADIPRIVLEAFHVATTGRPGPVLIDVPKDVSTLDHGVVLARQRRPARLPAGVQARPGGDRRRRSALLAEASGPVIYAGGGILKSGASKALARARRADRASRS